MTMTGADIPPESPSDGTTAAIMLVLLVLGALAFWLYHEVMFERAAREPVNDDDDPPPWSRE